MGNRSLIEQTIFQEKGKDVVRVHRQESGYHLENAGTLNAENKDELAQRMGNTQTKYTMRGMLMSDR